MKGGIELLTDVVTTGSSYQTMLENQRKESKVVCFLINSFVEDNSHTIKFIHWWIKKMWCIYICNSILLRHKKNEIMPFAATW